MECSPNVRMTKIKHFYLFIIIIFFIKKKIFECHENIQNAFTT